MQKDIFCDTCNNLNDQINDFEANPKWIEKTAIKWLRSHVTLLESYRLILKLFYQKPVMWLEYWNKF